MTATAAPELLGVSAVAGIAPRRRALETGLVLLGFTVVSLLIVCTHVFAQPRLSPFDELVYIDYVAKMPEQGVVRMGETLGPLAREAYACRGVMFFENTAAQFCGPGDGIDTDYPNYAFTTGDIYAPVYPAVAYAAMRLVMFAGVTDPVDAMRIGGAFWLVLAAGFLYAALRRLGAGIMPAVAVSLLLIGSLPALWNHTFVTTDATLMPAGALMLWLVVRLLQDGKGLVLLPVTAALFIIAKFQNVGSIMAAALVLVAAAIATGIAAARAGGEGAAGSRSPWLRGTIAALRSRPAIAVLVSAAVSIASLGAWLAIRSAIAIRKPPNHTMYESLEAGDVAREILRFLIGPGVGVDPMPFGPWAQVQGGLFTVLYVMGLVGAALTLTGRWALIGRCALIAALLLGPVLMGVVVLESGRYFALPERYGVGFIPWALAGVAALASRTRWLSWTILGIASAALLISQFQIVLR